MIKPKKINVLPRNVYNQISAGEVVERPASVVKELFENAVDAGADEITISIANGGLDEIFIRDNGCGISKEDLPKAFYPHATSKIIDASDILSLKTLGFRGEAIASIASVSEMRIVSKTADSEIGYALGSSGGELGEITEAPCADGTCVTVSKLFFNTPARLKFLKTARSEESEVTNLISRLILANSTVSVKYYADDELVLESYGDGLRDSVRAVYGSGAIDNCFEISYEKNGLLIEGFLGSTNYYKGNRTYQTTIVNGRWVSDNTVASAVANAYAPYLMKRQYAFYVLKIELAPELVDVNVHPQKTEVRFQDNGVIYAAVKSVVSRVLDGTSEALGIVVNQPIVDAAVVVERAEKPISEWDIRSKPVESLSYDRYREPIDKPTLIVDRKTEIAEKKEEKTLDYESLEYDAKPYKKKPSLNVAAYEQTFTDFTEEREEKSAEDELRADEIFAENKKYLESLSRKKEEIEQTELKTEQPFRLVGQALETYLILERGNEIIFIDQHAAHERILFDKFCLRLKTDSVIKQRLLFPYAFKVNALEAEMIESLQERFAEIGVDVTHDVANDLFKVCSVPVELIDLNLDGFFKEILTDDFFKDEKMAGAVRERLIQKACKSAIKSGDRLTELEINSLIEQLNENWALKCPHGRPVAVKITRTEIDKWFKRIV